MSDDLSKKVLIVEDDVDYRNALSAYLSGHGLEVSLAYDGEEAMEKLLFHLPKLVVLDLLLPKVKGLDFFKKAARISGRKHFQNHGDCIK